MVRSLDITRRYPETKILPTNFLIPDLQIVLGEKHGRSPGVSGKTLQQSLGSSLKRIQRTMSIMGKESLSKRGLLKYPGPLPHLAVLQKSYHSVGHPWTRRRFPPMPVTLNLSSFAPSWTKEFMALHLSCHKGFYKNCSA